MPQLTLVSNAVDYDLYERYVAAMAGVTTDQSALAVTSILPRSCAFRSISFPNIAANAASTLTIKDSQGREIRNLALGGVYDVFQDENTVPIIGVKLRGTTNNNVVDFEPVVA